MTVQERREFVLRHADVNPFFAYRVAEQMSKVKAEITPAAVHKIVSERPKPFVKWVGGKRQLLGQFKEKGLFPPEAFNPLKNTYHEPFVGGGAVFFDFLPLKANLSDMNGELVTTYNVIKDDLEVLITLLQNDYYTYDQERFYEIRELPKSRSLSELETATRFIYLNRTCFNGMYRVNKSGYFNVPFGRYTNPLICDTENLAKVSLSLQKTSIKKQDYKTVLDKAKKGDFVYFDPPYYPVSKTASFTAYTLDSFLEREQEELRDAYVELHNRGCYVMLSNSDTPFIESLFEPYAKEGIKVHKVQAGRAINSNAGKRGKVLEVLVTNY